MRFRRMIVTLTAAASLSLGLPLAAASAAPAAYSAAGVPAAAKAAAASTAQAGSHSVSVLSPGTHGSSATGGAVPLIKWSSCPGKTTTWVDIDVYQFRVAGLFDWCFGFTGTWRFPTSGALDYTSHFCAGNNRGNIVVKYWPSGTIRTFSFGPGSMFAWPTSNPPVSLVSLTITGWSGSNTCTS
jgi:hypothetical protein